jgi:uncharacterized protein
MRALRFALLAFALLLTLVAASATSYPALTGRVVDDANVLSAQTRADLTTKLNDLEDKSSIQLVVATVPSLDGQEIEPYANELFRTWKLGQAKNNNGVLLLVAPKEHRVRIEVGYGLEGTLTDVISKLIIVNAMAPRFKTGDYNGGIARGVDDIITALTTDQSEWQKKPDLRQQDDQSPGWLIFLVVIFFVIIFIIAIRHGGGRGGPGGFVIGAGSGFASGGSSGGGGGFSDSGGFSGGGGSSGGGGASGGW